MQVLKIYPNSINERFIDQAVEALRNGEVIIYPTDSLYAFGCDALNRRAIERLCKIKGLNPEKNLLSIVCADISQAADYARIDNKAFQLMKSYIPGPVTFILPSSTKLPKVFKGRKTVGVRVPDNPIATYLARALGNPLLTSSVNETDIILYDEDNMEAPLAENYPGVDLLIDGGGCAAEPSTIVDLADSDNPEIIRQGRAQIEL